MFDILSSSIFILVASCTGSSAGAAPVTALAAMQVGVCPKNQNVSVSAEEARALLNSLNQGQDVNVVLSQAGLQFDEISVSEATLGGALDYEIERENLDEYSYPSASPPSSDYSMSGSLEDVVREFLEDVQNGAASQLKCDCIIVSGKCRCTCIGT